MLRAGMHARSLALAGASAPVLVLFGALLWPGTTPAGAQSGEKLAKPTGLTVDTTRDSLDVSVDWDDIAGAEDYLVRWRAKDGDLNAGERAATSNAEITVGECGTWVVQTQACDDAGCNGPAARTFQAEADNFRSVCERTQQVRIALVEAAGKACGGIEAQDLARAGGLDLSNAGLRTLADDDLSYQTFLKPLKLKNNPNLRQVSGSASTDLDAVENIMMSDAGLSSLQSSQCPSNTNLATVHLSGNRLTSVPPGVFSGSTNLLWIDLGDNNTSSLSINAFAGLTSAESLDLTNNGITASGLPDQAFASPTALGSKALFGSAGAPFDLTNKVVLTTATVMQVAPVPTGFEAAPTNDGKIRLISGDPNDSNFSHQYRYQVGESWGAWTDISSPTTSDTNLQFDIADLTGGKSYALELRAKVGTSVSYHPRHPRYSFMFGKSGADTLTGTVDGHHIACGASDDVINSMDVPDWLRGGGNNTLHANGGGGYDTLHPRRGRDELKGVDETDTVPYATLNSGIVISPAYSTKSTGQAYGDTFESIKKIVGSGGNDMLIGDGKANNLSSAAGDDLLRGGGDNTPMGGAGNDEFYFYAGFGSDAIDDYTLGSAQVTSEEIHLCLGNGSNLATDCGVDGGSDRVITVTLDGAIAGTITLTGITSGFTNFNNLNVIAAAADGLDCTDWDVFTRFRLLAVGAFNAVCPTLIRELFILVDKQSTR